MEQQALRQPWHRLGSLSWLMALFMTAALADVNLDALVETPFAESKKGATRKYRIETNGDQSIIELPHENAFHHGWPLIFLSRLREDVQWMSYPTADQIADENGDLRADLFLSGPPIPTVEHHSHWPFDSAPVVGFSIAALGANIAVALAVLCGSIWTTECWSRRTGVKATFSLKAVLALAAWAATIAALAGHEVVEWIPQLARVVAVVMLMVGIGLAWLAAIDLAGLLFSTAWRRPRRRMRANPAIAHDALPENAAPPGGENQHAS